MRNMLNPAPSRAQLRRFAVNRPGMEEAVRQPLYDFQAYAQAGQSSLTFFALPQGQGTTSAPGATGVKTISDTNMDSAGTLPQPKHFLLESIEVLFFPGLKPGIFGAEAVSNFSNDVYAFGTSGHLQLFIGSKPYLDDAPLGLFAPQRRLSIAAAYSDASTAANSQSHTMDYASWVGARYQIDPEITLESQQNFKVILDWPANVALSAGDTTARVGVRLNGILYRLSQ